MRILLNCLILLSIGIAQQVFAAGIVHIADGDCAALSTAAASPKGQEPALIGRASCRERVYACV